MFADPSCGEALNFLDPFGELARDVAFDPAADQRDFELHSRVEASAASRLPTVLAPPSPRPDPGAPVTATVISPLTRRSPTGRHFSVLQHRSGHRGYNLASIPGSAWRRRSSVVATVTVPSASTTNESSVLLPPKAAESGQPVVLVAESRMDLFDAGRVIR